MWYESVHFGPFDPLCDGFIPFGHFRTLERDSMKMAKIGIWPKPQMCNFGVWTPFWTPSRQGLVRWAQVVSPGDPVCPWVPQMDAWDIQGVHQVPQGVRTLKYPSKRGHFRGPF